jgi:uncharacterized membrane protein
VVIEVVSNTMLVLLGWIHILAVVIWGGGAVFLTFIYTPNSARLPPKEAASLGQAVSKQFAKLGWLMIILIAVTGLLRMYLVNMLSLSLLLNTSYGQILLVKGLIFLVMIVLVMQITSTGMKLEKVSSPEDALPLQKRLGLLSKTTISLGFVAVLLAVALRHGGF